MAKAIKTDDFLKEFNEMSTDQWLNDETVQQNVFELMKQPNSGAYMEDVSGGYKKFNKGEVVYAQFQGLEIVQMPDNFSVSSEPKPVECAKLKTSDGEMILVAQTVLLDRMKNGNIGDFYRIECLGKPEGKKYENFSIQRFAPPAAK